MPTVLNEGGYQFIIFTSDHPPAHVHVRREGKLAKVMLDPVKFDRLGGFNAGEQKKILSITRKHREFLLSKWNELHVTEEE